jgi:tetratricopeptide (TPR) repeat protein
MSTQEERARLTERRDLITNDIEELAAQVDAGEIDADTAADLRSRYIQDLAEVEAQIAELPKEDAAVTQQAVKASSKPSSAPTEPPTQHATMQGWSPKRVIIGGVILVVAFTVVLVTVIAAANRSTTTTTVAAAADDTLAQMEAAVAANPDLVAMRLALADQYLSVQNFTAAKTHYETVVESPDATETQASHALSMLGYLSYATGQPDQALDYEDQALEVDPTNLEATLIKGITYLYGLEDAASALPLLEEVMTDPELPDDMRTQIQAAIDDANAALGS